MLPRQKQLWNINNIQSFEIRLRWKDMTWVRVDLERQFQAASIWWPRAHFLSLLYVDRVAAASSAVIDMRPRGLTGEKKSLLASRWDSRLTAARETWRHSWGWRRCREARFIFSFRRFWSEEERAGCLRKFPPHQLSSCGRASSLTTNIPLLIPHAWRQKRAWPARSALLPRALCWQRQLVLEMWVSTRFSRR